MELSGAFDVAASRDRVWATVVDPRWLTDCAQGIESVEAIEDGRFRAHAKVRVGFFSVGLTVDLERLETAPPDRVVLGATGRAAGSQVTARAEIRLAGAVAGPTSVHWHATVTPSGAVAGIGDQMIESSAARLVDDGIACLKQRLEGAPQAAS